MQTEKVIQLGEYGLIQVIGDNAKKFLQGQLSCDINEINENQSRMAVHCNHKGRVIATMIVLYFENHYYLLTPIVMIEKLISTLTKYAQFSRVQLQDKTSEFVIFGLVNFQPEKIAQLKDSGIIIRINELSSRYLCIQSTIQENLIPNTTSAEWELLNIQEGIPTILPSTEEKFTPHQINFQLIGGISFTKGCYTGQEIIARTQYLGHLKQQMYRLKAQEELLLKSGDKLFCHEEEIGTVVNTCKQRELLAVLKNSVVTSGKMFDVDGVGKLVIQELPYNLS